MKKFIKRISAAALTALILAASALTAFAAASAKTGDSVSLKVSITGVSNMGSTTVEIHYDKDKLDLLSDETLAGMGVANTTVEGQIIWGALFDAQNGSDFSNKTDVFNAVFIAKQNIDNVDSLIQFSVRDAFSVDYNKVDASKLSYSVEIEEDSTASQTTSSKSDITVSEYVGNGNNPSDNNTQSNSASNSNSASASNTSSAAGTASSEAASSSSSQAASSKNSESSASESSAVTSSKKAESEAEDSSVTAASSEITAASYDEAEFESVPPIKLDTQDAADSGSSAPEKSSHVGAIIAVVVCLVIAAAGTVILIVKKKH